MKRKRLNTILLVLLLLILLPALMYTGYELSRLSESESELSQLYEQQLDAVLFSINQYAWDITGSWMNMVEQELSGSGDVILTGFPDDRGSPDFLSEFLQSTPSVHAVLLFDSTGSLLRELPSPMDTRPRFECGIQLSDSLRGNDAMRARLLRLHAGQYQKIEPVQLSSDSGSSMLALVATVRSGSGRTLLVALCIDSEFFINLVLGPKFHEIAGDSFLLFCVDTRDNRIVLATTATSGKLHLSQSRSLWLFPHYEFGIRLKDRTLQDVAEERFRENSILFLSVDLLLVIAALFVYRNLRREVELAQLKSDFVSNVSHELKTPLALIRMYAETLEMNRISSEEKKREYYSIIVQETERLTRLINNVLTFSRIEAGRKKYRFAETDINRVVGDVMSMYRFHLEHRGYAAEVQTATELPRIQADEEAVAEALLNLLDNAMKYSGDTKEIRLATGTENDMVFIAVRDRGIGIAAEHQKHIFEKFYRVSDGLVHTAKGSGLGLSLVSHIMNAHGGKVELKSEPGEGSCFRLYFPCDYKS